MRDSDVLDKNPHVSRSAMEAIHGQVFGWALSRCDYDPNVAEDLMQQAYVQLLTGKARFENKSSLKTFVFSVVQNLARSRYRRIASRFRLLQAAGLEAVDDVVQPTEPDETAALWNAVQELPQRQRDIVELVFCRDMTIEAASSVMGVTTGTGRVRRRQGVLAGSAVIGLGVGLANAAGPKEDVFKGKLFAPNVILEHQTELKLSKAQFTDIRATVFEVQAGVAEHEWDMREAYQALMQELDKVPIDEDRVIEHANVALLAENQVKKKQMVMLVRLKNLLTAEQVSYLESVQPK